MAWENQNEIIWKNNILYEQKVTILLVDMHTFLTLTNITWGI